MTRQDTEGESESNNREKVVTEWLVLLLWFCCCVYTQQLHQQQFGPVARLGWGLWPGVTLNAMSDRPWKVGERLVKAFSPTSSATKVKFK